jgi:hypothetical protein
MMHESEFFFDSELSKERQKEILKWVNSLKSEEYSMIQDLIRDTRNEEQYEAAAEAAGADF